MLPGLSTRTRLGFTSAPPAAAEPAPAAAAAAEADAAACFLLEGPAAPSSPAAGASVALRLLDMVALAATERRTRRRVVPKEAVGTGVGTRRGANAAAAREARRGAARLRLKRRSASVPTRLCPEGI